MTVAACTHPITWADVVDYWAGELQAGDESHIEAHVFACPACAAVLAEGEMLATGIRHVVRSGAFQSLVSEAVLNRLARDGVRVRTFAVRPGEVVPCAVWEDDEVIVTRLTGDFSGADTVSLVCTLASGEELSRSDGVSVRPDQRELLTAFSAAALRRLPAIAVQLRVTAYREKEDRLLGEYTLMHGGALRHG